MSVELRSDFLSAAETPAPAGHGGKGRILLVEDDEAFRSIVAEYLAESGYSIVAVAGGGEAVRLVVDGDFSLVLCDMNMPGLSGEMFYRAVERVRPRLCDRFIFMTGCGGESKAEEFLQKINGFVLRKPFHVANLLDAVALAEVRGEFTSVFDPAAAETRSLSEDSPPRFLLPATESAAPVPGPPVEPAAGGAAPIEAGTATPRKLSVARNLWVIGAFLAFALAAVILGMRSMDVQRRAAAAEAAQDVAEAELAVVAAQLAEAEKSRGGLASLSQRAQRLAEERARRGWTGALSAVVAHSGAQIGVRGITARGISGGCELDIDGTAGGDAPRLIADKFNRALRETLRQKFPGHVVSGSETYSDEVEPSAPNAQRTRFALSIRIENPPAPSEASQ